MNKEITTKKISSGKSKNIYIRRDICETFNSIIKNFVGPIIIYDLETTGLSKVSDRIVQIAAIKLVRNEEGLYRVKETMNQYIRPPFPMPEAASNVNHITDEMLRDAPTEDEIFEKIEHFFGNVNCGSAVVTGYNIMKFDNVLMSNMYKRHGKEGFAPILTVDIMDMSMEMIDRDELKDRSFKQENVAELFSFKEQTMHNAFTDVMVSGRILWRLYEDYLKFRRMPKGYYDSLPKVTILGMYEMKKSKTSNFIIVNVTGIIQGNVQNGQFHYDLYNKRYVEDDGDLMNQVDMLKFSLDADRYAGGSISHYRSAKRSTRRRN